MSSLFDFLKDDYRTIYLYCISMEKLIKAGNFKLASLTSKIISEEILKNLNNKEFNLKTTIYSLQKNNAFSKNNDKNEKTAKKHIYIQKFAFDSIHNPDFEITNPQIIHELVFDVLIEFYNSQKKPIFLKYKYDLEYYDNNIDNPTYPEYEFITKDELDNIFYKYNENSVYKSDLIKFILSQKQILTKNQTKNILNEFIPVNKNQLDDFFQNKFSFITPEDISFILDKYYSNQLSVSEFTAEEDKQTIINIITTFNDEVINLNEIYLDKYYHILKEAIEDLIKSNLKRFLENNLLEIYTTDYIIKQNRKLRRYTIFKNDNGYSFKEIKENIILDGHQKKAITYPNKKPLVIDAGPGAGKTKVIIERVVFLINKLNTPPSSILVITFTNKAADELKERFKTDTDLSLEIINQMKISTIHSFCRFILDSFDMNPKNYLDRNGEKGLFLQKHKEELGFVKESFLYNFQMPHAYYKYDEYNTFEVDNEGLIEYIKKNKPINPDYLKYIENFYKDNPDWVLPKLAEIDDMNYSDDLYNARYLQIAKSYPIYRDIMEREDVSDHELLLIKTFEFFDKNPSSIKSIPFRNILIDEFQDTDPIQMKIFEKLLENCDTFTVVGDVDQSIYGFRGSYTTFFTDFANNSKYELIPLVFNYRSTKDIVDFNEALIKPEREIKKSLEATNPYKMPVFNIQNPNNYNEAKNIVKIIKHLKENNKIEKYGDIAILFRSRNKNIDAIIKEIENEGIPFYLKDQNDLINQDETKAILAMFWYLTHDNSPYITNYDEKTWLNILAFADTTYESNKIFDLSQQTINKIKEIETTYRNNLLKEELNVKGEKSPNYKTLLKNKQYILEKIFKKYDKPDLSVLTKEELINIGINDEHDINFFLSLNKLKSTINDKIIENRYKPTTLELFFKILKLTKLHEKLFTSNSYNSTKALMNLAQISEIIDDYENIIGKYDYNGLYDYLKRIIKTYSCPINETEDNSNKVHIMTVHSSKGLEYPVVILSSLKEKSFPRQYNENYQKKKYINQKPTYYTPREFLKYKPNTKIEEEKQYNQEEKRIMYVSTTRAEELLILSTLNNNNHKIPKVLENAKNKFEILDINNLDVIRKVKTKRRIKNEEIRVEIQLENILEDYLFCPLKYNLKNNLGYRSIKNNTQFIKLMINKIFNLLHNPDTVVNINDLDNIINTLIKSHDLKRSKDFKQLNKLFNNIKKYWSEFGNKLEILDFNVNILENFNKIDLSANIDLVVLENNNNISIIQFIINDNIIKNYENHYMNHLNYYGGLLEKNRNFKQYNVSNIILYNLESNKLIKKEYNQSKNDFTQKILINILENINNRDYARYKVNCDNCEFKHIICDDNI